MLLKVQLLQGKCEDTRSVLVRTCSAVAWHDTCCTTQCGPTWSAVPSRTSSPRVKRSTDVGMTMLWTLFMVLLVLWLLGVVSSYTLGGFIHLLLVLAVVAVLVQLISGRRVV